MVVSLSIRSVAARTGLTVHTLRYYDQVGLLPDVNRSEAGHRRFTDANVEWIRFVQKLRATGMPIAQIQRYAAFARDGDVTGGERRKLLDAHRVAIENQIHQLGDALDLITAKLAYYDSLLVLRSSRPRNV